MNKLRKDAFKSPVYHITIIALLSVGLVSLPIGKLFELFVLDEYKAELLGGIFLRVALSIGALFAIIKYGFLKPFYSHDGVKSFLLCIPALIVAVNNFPILAVINGNAQFTNDSANVILYVIYCISVGLFEEFIFCGLIFPLCIYIHRHKKYSVIWACLISSGIFAISHLMNLFGGANFGATLLQVCYSFLIGAMCCICKCVTRNIFTAVVLHSIYDIGGLVFSSTFGIGVGNQWDIITIVITAILGVLVALHIIRLGFKVDHDEVKDVYFERDIDNLINS